MNKLLSLTLGIVLLGALGINSFEFAERPFGSLKPRNVGCESKGMVSPYSDLIYLEMPRGDNCWLRYETKKEIIRLPDGGGKLTGTSVTVSAQKYDNPELLKKSLINPSSSTPREYAIEGKSLLSAAGGDIVDWISGNYKIRVMKSGESMEEADEIVEYYLDKYPPTYSITSSDLDQKNINEYELERHMQVINNAESYRNILRTKSDKYAGTMAQCKEEATIRSAAGLCEEAFIAPEKTPAPGRRKTIGCPIAMTFDSSERRKLWKDLERRALKSERLDFNVDTWECSYVGPQWYYYHVGKELGFTNLEFRLMYKLGVPEQFLPQFE